MANVFHKDSKTWECTQTGVLTTERVKIHNVRWAGAAQAGDVAKLAGNDSGDFFKSTSETSNWDDEQLIRDWVNGLQITAIDSGTLYIILW